MLSVFAFLLLFAPEAEPIDAELKRFVEVYAAVKENAADPLPSARAMYEGAIPGMLKALDPHSVFFDPGNFDQLRELENSTRKGFGSIVSLLPGRVIVLQVLPNTPSAKSGMLPGDEILAINGIDLGRLEVEQLVQLLSQARQHQVRVDVRRPGSARLLPLILTPEDVDSPSVDRAFLLQDGIGYIRVSTFDAKVAEHVQKAIDSLGGESLRGLVLDLRNNPGGIAESAIETAGLFLEPGRKILSVKGRAVTASDTAVPKDAKPYRFPVAVLLNGKSASASEILAGALQDHKRAKVFGERSYGKGLVQRVFPMSEGTGLALTTAFYYTPNGRSIQRPLHGQLEATTAANTGGIEPDQTVYPEPMTRLRAFLDGSGAFVSWATEYLQRAKPSLDGKWEVSSQVLDEFQTWLSSNNVRPGLAEWSREREWIRSRLHQEIFNLGLGVDRGDEIEGRRDPVVQTALRSMTQQ